MPSIRNGNGDLTLISTRKFLRRHELCSTCLLDGSTGHFTTREYAKIRTVASAFAVCTKWSSLLFTLRAGRSVVGWDFRGNRGQALLCAKDVKVLFESEAANYITGGGERFVEHIIYPRMELRENFLQAVQNLNRQEVVVDFFLRPWGPSP